MQTILNVFNVAMWVVYTMACSDYSYPQLTRIFPSVVNKRSSFFFSCTCGILIRMLGGAWLSGSILPEDELLISRLWKWLKGGDGVNHSCRRWQWDHVAEWSLCGVHGEVWLCGINSHITIVQASHTGGHLSTLAKCVADVYENIHALTHSYVRVLIIIPHHPLFFYSSSWLTFSKTSGIDRSMLLGKNSVVTAVVCLCVFLFSAQKQEEHLSPMGFTLPAVLL